MLVIGRAQLGRGQKSGNPSWSPMWVAGAHILEPSYTAFPGTIIGSRMGRVAAGTLTATLIWDAGVPSNGLICSSTTSTSDVTFKERD